MSLLKPSDPTVLATAVADSLVVFADETARQSNGTYWERARPWTEAVVTAVQNAEDVTSRQLGESLLGDPTDPLKYRAMRAALVERCERPETAAIFELGWRAECHSRMGYHLGPMHERGAVPVSAPELLEVSPGARRIGGQRPDVLIVVPFREKDPKGARLRNLLACLLSLGDQSYPRERYQVTVVESDETPRWHDTISPFADHYLFAPKQGAFNKSWAVNAGVVNTAGAAEVICILDSDILVDRDYITRNVARFQRPGTAGHLTYRNLLCLDETSTSVAIHDRIHLREARARTERLRGFVLRRPPGASLWVRSEAFHRVSGLNERYEGWGFEDNDFLFRMHLAVPFDSYDDDLLHMPHPPAAILMEGGERVSARIPWASWRPDEPIGQLDRFVIRTTIAS